MDRLSIGNIPIFEHRCVIQFVDHVALPKEGAARCDPGRLKLSDSRRTQPTVLPDELEKTVRLVPSMSRGDVELVDSASARNCEVHSTDGTSLWKDRRSQLGEGIRVDIPSLVALSEPCGL